MIETNFVDVSHLMKVSSLYAYIKPSLKVSLSSYLVNPPLGTNCISSLALQANKETKKKA